MKTRMILVAWVMVVSLILTACTPITTPAATLNDTSWVLADLGGQTVLTEPLITISFSGDKLNGTDGCNRYSGSYTANRGRFSVNEDMISTMMACPETIMQQATAYITALKQAATYKINGKQLTLLDGRGKTLVTFTAQSRELRGTSWVVTGYNNGKQAVVSVVADTELTADFGADGRLSGSAGCNNYTATYETSGQSIKISQAASTRKMCGEPKGVMEQETQYLQALATAATYRLDGNWLELRTADGALVATFEKVR